MYRVIPGLQPMPSSPMPAGALVGVERLEQERLVRLGGRVDDAPVLEAEPDPGHLAAAIDGGELGERDHALGRVLDRAAEELAARQVRAERVDLHRATLEREAQIGAVADDPHLRRGVEVGGDRRASARPRVPVLQHRPVEQLGELLGPEPGLLGECGRRVLARDPRDVVVHDPLAGRPVCRLERGQALAGNRRPTARVLSGAATKSSASTVCELVRR